MKKLILIIGLISFYLIGFSQTKSINSSGSNVVTKDVQGNVIFSGWVTIAQSGQILDDSDSIVDADVIFDYVAGLGYVTNVTGGTGIISSEGTTPSITLDLSELSITTMVGGDWIAFDDAGTSNKALISDIPLSIFNNDLDADDIPDGSTYTIITLTQKTNFGTAYDDKINSAAFNTSDGVITLTQQDAGTVTVDIDGRFVPLETMSDHAVLRAAGTTGTYENTGVIIDDSDNITGVGGLTASGSVVSDENRVQSLTETAGAVAWDYADGAKASVTIDETTVITITNFPDGMTADISIIQGDADDDDVTFVHAGLTVKWRGNDKELTDTNGADDGISLLRIGSILRVTLGSNYITQ